MNVELNVLSNNDINIEKVFNDAENCLQLIIGGNNLSDEEYCTSVSKFASISDWNEHDYYNVIELVSNQKFEGVGTIMTTMLITQNKYGCDNEQSVNLKVLYAEGVEIFGTRYTIEEIQKMLREKKIVIIDEELSDIVLKDFVPQEYYRFEHAYNNKVHDFFEKNGKYYPFTLKYVSRKFDKKVLCDFFRELFINASNELETYKSSTKSNTNSPQISIYENRLSNLDKNKRRLRIKG